MLNCKKLVLTDISALFYCTIHLFENTNLLIIIRYINYMETTKASSGILTPNLFIKGTEGEEIDKEFICKICNSIALKPKMCKSCDHLYCSDCIENPQEQKCKNRDCGRESIGDPNKFMLRTLHSFKFKCKYPDCPVISSYEEFLIHYETCSFK